jgi:glycosyltransferase involved in cell wall biosynthesis
MPEIILVGVVSNVEKKLYQDLLRVINALSDFKKVSIYLVESDSTDKTPELLNKIASKIPNFTFLSLGDLKSTIPSRIARLRYCRNEYVAHIRSIPNSLLPEYVAVADLDGMNKALSNKAVATCFSNQNWDVVLSNQKYGYYDIFALRHKDWQPTDCFTQLETLKQNIPRTEFKKNSLIGKLRLNWAYDRARKDAIYSKMIRIRRNSPWVQVDSGFGGFAIYKSELFLQHDYSTNNLSSEQSEHVALHSKIVSTNRKIFINPALINSHFNTHNLNRYLLIREFRRLVNNEGLMYRYLKRYLWKF